jgi:hypothetical protein
MGAARIAKEALHCTEKRAEKPYNMAHHGTSLFSSWVSSIEIELQLWGVLVKAKIRNSLRYKSWSLKI